MKADIHPQYNTDIQVTCACGNTFTVGSTKDAIEIEVCSACHPFYTGQERTVDTAGRLDKFRAKQQKAQAAQQAAKQRAGSRKSATPTDDTANADVVAVSSDEN